MSDEETLQALPSDTVRHLVSEHRSANFPAELNAYLFGLTAEEQDELMAGNDAVWLTKDTLDHRRCVEDRLTAIVTDLERALAELRARRSTT